MTEPRSLATISEATRMLGEARTLEDVRQVRDLAEAARVYAKQHKLGIESQNYAGSIVVESDIRRGEILKQMAEDGERQAPGMADGTRSEPSLPTLADMNTTKRESSDAQVLAGEADAVRAWMATTKEVRPTRAARVARSAKAARERRARVPAAVLPTTCKLHQGDFREVLKYIPDGSVDAIITDPPYPAEFLPLWGDLGSFAARVLRPGGLLVAMSGQLHLPAVMKLLEVHLPYRWVIAYMTPGQGPAIHARKIENHWKPVLVYGGTERWLHDVVNSDAPDKEHHDWGQSESGMAALIRLVADPGQMICDPFVGGGTTGVVALDYGCSFTGAELEQEAYEKALTRLAL